MRVGLALALLVPCLAGAGLHAPAPQSWSIDPSHSEVRFSVRKFWLTHARGTFSALRGDLRQAGGDLVQVDALLDVATLRMDDAHDRERALGPDFFDAGRFPTIGFHSEPFPPDRLASGGPLRGTLTLHGESQPATLRLLPSTCPLQPIGCPLRAHGTISRADFGMDRWRGVLGDRVELDLRIVLRTDAARPASPAPAAATKGER